MLHIQKASSFIVSIPSGIITFRTALLPNRGIYFKLAGKVISALQLANVFSPNKTSLFGNCILLRDTQLLNVLFPIDVTESDKTRFVNSEQFSKALSSIFFTEFGIFSSFNDEHSASAPQPITAKVSGNIILSTLVNPAKDTSPKYVIFPLKIIFLILLLSMDDQSIAASYVSPVPVIVIVSPSIVAVALSPTFTVFEGF